MQGLCRLVPLLLAEMDCHVILLVHSHHVCSAPMHLLSLTALLQSPYLPVQLGKSSRPLSAHRYANVS